MHDRHLALGATFGEFGGWAMPLHYTSVVAEHKAVRGAVGVFDVSHLGKVRVSGPGARDFVNSCLTNDLRRIGPGQAQYTFACTEQGGVVDDIMSYLISDEEVFLVPNAANNADVVALLSREAPSAITIENEHRLHATIAVQGPASDEVLRAVGAPCDQDFMHFRQGEVAGVAVTVCRTGYTGEHGYEIFAASDEAGPVWDAVLTAGEGRHLLPCGLGARDTLRTEMGYPLHGHELGFDITPVQARAGWAVGWDKPVFWGADALRAQRAAKPSRLILALKSRGRGIPRRGMRVLDAAGVEVGTVTSGTYSPSLGVGIALALLDRTLTPGAEVAVEIRGRTEPFTVEKPPLVTPSVRER